MGLLWSFSFLQMISMFSCLLRSIVGVTYSNSSMDHNLMSFLFLFSFLYSCSTDKTVSKWDLEVCERVKKYKGHQAYVNSVDVARRGPQLLCSGSDDGTVKVCSHT